jgi:hypothetical protein
MTLEILVLVWVRHKHEAGLNRLMDIFKNFWYTSFEFVTAGKRRYDRYGRPIKENASERTINVQSQQHDVAINLSVVLLRTISHNMLIKKRYIVMINSISNRNNTNYSPGMYQNSKTDALETCIKHCGVFNG